MWGFWWILPVVGLAICPVFVFAMMRMMSGGRFMCMGSHLHESKRDFAGGRRSAGAAQEASGDAMSLSHSFERATRRDGRRLALPARNVADAAAAGCCYFTNRTGHRQKMPTL